MNNPPSECPVCGAKVKHTNYDPGTLAAEEVVYMCGGGVWLTITTDEWLERGCLNAWSTTAALRAENARLNAVLDQVAASTARIEAGIDRAANYNASLRAELAAVTAERDGEAEKSKDLMDQLLYLTDYYDANDYEAAAERVILMRRDNQRAAAARRVAAYCRELRQLLADGLMLADNGMVLMSADQVGQWAGVRAWQEYATEFLTGERGLTVPPTAKAKGGDE